MSDELQTAILHGFADLGVESEFLSAYGSVTRATINPEPNDYSEVVVADLSDPDELPFEEGEFDLALLHPPCTRWSRMTSISGNPEDHPNLIPEAREIGERYADHHIIENQPEAPLRDATVLTGKMFGLPIQYERAFETSFRVEEPPRHQSLPTECSPYFSADRTKTWWRTTKGVRGDYPKEHLVKNALPSVYVNFLVRSWTRAVNQRDAQKAQDNCGRAPRGVTAEQAELTEVR